MLWSVLLCASELPTGHAYQAENASTPVYAYIEGSLLRVKWAEVQERAKLDETTFEVFKKPLFKSAVLVANLEAKTAKPRLSPP